MILGDLLNWILSLFGAAPTSAAELPAREHTAADLVPLTPQSRVLLVRQIITSQDLDGMNPDHLLVMFDMEQGLAEGMLTDHFLATNSLSNRHVGEGRVGVPNSDGEWTGRSHELVNARGELEDLRIYVSLESSVRDFMNLMNLRRYAMAKVKSQEDDGPGYFAAMAAAGYSDQPGYAGLLAQRAHSLGVA